MKVVRTLSSSGLNLFSCILFLKGNCLDENLPSVWTSLSSSCGSYHRRLYRSHATSIDRSFGRKSEELSGDVSEGKRFYSTESHIFSSHVDLLFTFLENPIAVILKKSLFI